MSQQKRGFPFVTLAVVAVAGCLLLSVTAGAIYYVFFVPASSVVQPADSGVPLLAVTAVEGQAAAPEAGLAEATQGAPAVTETVLPAATAAPPLPADSPEARALAGVTSNNQWQPHIVTFDGDYRALVPAGCFTMGSDAYETDERPAHPVCLQAYWIDVAEVSAAAYRGALAAGDQAVEQVSWFDAVAYCESRGARLPSEAEWEYAARGPDNLMYPWGNEFDSRLVVYNTIRAYPSDSIPENISWVGAYAMSGNVYEWVNSLYRDYPYNPDDGREATGAENGSDLRVLRGGGWASENENSLRAAFRYFSEPSGAYNGIGFRCAMDLSPAG